MFILYILASSCVQIRLADTNIYLSVCNNWTNVGDEKIEECPKRENTEFEIFNVDDDLTLIDGERRKELARDDENNAILRARSVEEPKQVQLDLKTVNAFKIIVDSMCLALNEATRAFVFEPCSVSRNQMFEFKKSEHQLARHSHLNRYGKEIKD